MIWEIFILKYQRNLFYLVSYLKIWKKPSPSNLLFLNRLNFIIQFFFYTNLQKSYYRLKPRLVQVLKVVYQYHSTTSFPIRLQVNLTPNRQTKIATNLLLTAISSPWLENPGVAACRHQLLIVVLEVWDVSAKQLQAVTIQCVQVHVLF